MKENVKSTPKMNPKIKKKLVAALRSGKYRKGTYSLKQKDNGKNKFCCLGVLCDLYRKETGKGEWDGSMFIHGVSGLNADEEYLPLVVSNWSGLKGKNKENPLIKGIALSDYNDGAYAYVGKLSFSKIADLIEKNL